MNSTSSVPNTSPRITVRIDVEQDINRFLFFLRTTSYRVKRSNILRFYPTMNDRITRGEDEQTVVREMVSDMYQRYDTQIEHIVSATAMDFSRAESVFSALARYMDFPELSQRTYVAIPTFLPFSPLDQDQFYFSIAMAIAKGPANPLSYVAIAVHEISHFILLEQYKTWQPQQKLLLTDPAYHYFKEALTAAVMDQAEFRTFFNYPQLLKSETYRGNPELHELIVEIRGEQMPIKDAFIRTVLEHPSGYTAGLHQELAAFAGANSEFDEKWRIWNDVGGSFAEHPDMVAKYRQAIHLAVIE